MASDDEDDDDKEKVSAWEIKRKRKSITKLYRKFEAFHCRKKNPLCTVIEYSLVVGGKEDHKGKTASDTGSVAECTEHHRLSGVSGRKR